jgi:O-acetylserine/cysteine efflux transporter
MSARHFLLLFAVCLTWGINFVVSKWAVTGEPGWLPGFDGVPPFFFAFMRFALLYACLAPWLRPIPKDWKTFRPIIGAGLTMGAMQFGLMFMALQTASPSAVAIVVQLAVPFTTILSIIFLGETVRWIRGIGMALAFVGTGLVVAKPAELAFTLGLLFAMGGAFMAAAGTIFIKQTKLEVLSLQAWIGLISWPPLLAMSLFFETGQIGAVVDGQWPFFWVLIFTVVAVNIFGHGAFYYLLRQYDASLIAPLSLMAPLIGVVAGILILNDPVTWQLVLGGVIAFAGVGVVAGRRAKTVPPTEAINRV